MKKIIFMGLLTIFFTSNILASEHSNKVIQVSDLLLDFNDIIDNNVCVSGNMVAMGDVTLLQDKDNVGVTINLNTTQLERNIRKKIMQSCTLFDPCRKVILCGVVAHVSFLKGLIVKEVK